jgi:hypothetical protein
VIRVLSEAGSCVTASYVSDDCCLRMSWPRRQFRHFRSHRMLSGLSLNIYLVFYAVTYSLAPFEPRSKCAGACTLKPRFCEGHCSSAQPRPPRALCGQGTRPTRSTAQRCTWACALGHSRGARSIGRAGYAEGRNIDPLGHILGKSTTFRPYLAHFQVFLQADWTPKKPCQFCRCA